MEPRTGKTSLAIVMSAQEFRIVCLLWKSPLRHGIGPETCTGLVTSCFQGLQDEPRPHFSRFLFSHSLFEKSTLSWVNDILFLTNFQFLMLLHIFFSVYKHLYFNLFPVSQGSIPVIYYRIYHLFTAHSGQCFIVHPDSRLLC